jgi:hypothetical protein
LDPVKNGVVSQRAYDRRLDDVKRRVALDILAEVRRTIREQSGDYVRLKVFYPTADTGKKSANEIFVIGLELGAVEISVMTLVSRFRLRTRQRSSKNFARSEATTLTREKGLDLG